MNDKMVYIVLINYNGSEDTIECVESLSKNIYSNYKIIIVDNGSTEQERNKLKQISNSFVEIYYTDNHGFSGGSNIGIRFALRNGADYVCLLNNDTTVEPDFLEKMVQKAESSKDVGIVSPVLYDYYNRENIAYYGGVVNLFRGVVMSARSREEYVNLNTTCPFFATGCCMLIKREVFKTVGFLDESYFLYYEDTDYSVRVGKRYNLVLEEDAKVYHKESASTDKLGNLRNYYLYRNRLIFIKNNVSFFYKPVAYFWGIGGVFKFFLIHRNTSSLMALFDFFRGIRGQGKMFEVS